MHNLYLPELLPGTSQRQALLSYPSRLFVEATSRSNQHDPVPLSDGDLDPSTFNALHDAFPRLDALVFSGAGETLLNVHLEQFVSRAKKLMPPASWIGFQSNGILLTNMRAISLLDAGVDRVCLSMEGAEGGNSRGGSCGTPLLDLEWALKALASAKAICGRPGVEVGVEYVIRGNLEELPAALEWAASRGASFAVVSGMHCHAPSAEPQPRDAAETERFFAECRSAALAQGIDLFPYFELLWKSHKTREERKVIHFVAAVRDEAQQRGIPLDLRRLVQGEERRREEEGAVLERALAVAAQVGLELRLPEPAGRGGMCRFVEQGGAFISWDGSMHPCYRLWRECRGGDVARRGAFGNVVQQGVLQVWNSASFSAYREGVLERGEASCRGCDCPEADALGEASGSFDYHCGSCLWSAGADTVAPQHAEMLCL